MQYVCSWSGGKDSCLALHRAVEEWGKPQYLLSMLAEEGTHSRSHGIPRRILEDQAEALETVLRYGVASWDDYERVFVEALQGMASEGVSTGVFGDLDLDEHRAWEEMVCSRAGMQAELPLWHEAHEALAEEFLAAGYEAIVVTVRTDALPEEFLGERYTRRFLARLRSVGVDVAGEGGEFHTLVLDGPLFRRPVRHDIVGVRRFPGYAVLELS
ncbi:diphthine--ammonia ligase [bacterium]|nr:diphthine--ammonia ligase [bacterium]